MKLQTIVASVREYHREADFEQIQKAYSFVADNHKGQTRSSGEPYVTHVAEVAYLATKLKLDVPSIVAALLHDVVEDTKITLPEIEQHFGSIIANLVDGVTKLNQIKFTSKAEAQAENFRKMLLAMAKDIRVILIKLCDRTHNMRTLEFLSESRQQRIAQETLDIYAPLAHRLGIYWMKSELEDLALRYLKPEIHRSIKEHIKVKQHERDKYIDYVVRLIERELEQNGIKGDVKGRSKHFFSIYEKMNRHQINFDEINDLTAFRIIVPSQMECYAALGVMHAAWKPIPGRFKDYIAMPKANGYQSLHTTMIGPEGQRIEIQIRTPEMHDVAERGIAAHWVYKEISNKGKVNSANQKTTPEFNWLNSLVESGKSLEDPIEFISIVKDDLFPREVFVFSPKGDLYALTAGATPIDFAFLVHSKVGHHCLGAKVNGQQVPLSHKLRNGDSVEILTSPKQTPAKDWLKIAVTSKAKQKIRIWLKNQELNQSIIIGKELLNKELKRAKLNLSKIQKEDNFQKLYQDLGYRDLDLLFADLGYGKLSAAGIVKKLLPEDLDLDKQQKEDEANLKKLIQKSSKTNTEASTVKISGLSNFVYHFAHCCEPLPGDELLGFITRGRGVAIHTRKCTHTLSFDPHRLIEVAWEEGIKTLRKIKIKIIANDRIGLFAALGTAISNNAANILNADLSTTDEGKAINIFEIAINSLTQLSEVIRSLENVPGVIRVERYKQAEL